MIALKVIFGDPSDMQGGDAFAWVGAQMNLDGKNIIDFKLAKQFWNEKHSTCANWAKKTHDKINPNFMGMETNRKDDKAILKLYKTKYNMSYLHGINTSANLTEKTRSMGYTMDKSFQVDWFKKKMKKGEIRFPALPTKDMKDLIDQIPQITAQMTPTGQTTYRAQRNRHDDLFLAALHCSNIIRLFIEQQERMK